MPATVTEMVTQETIRQIDTVRGFFGEPWIRDPKSLINIKKATAPHQKELEVDPVALLELVN